MHVAGTSRQSMASIATVLVVLGTAGVRMGILAILPPDTRPWTDGAQYVNLAASLADGQGYRLKEGNFWPGQPTIMRAPGWPGILSLVFRVFPRDWNWQVARMTAVCLDAFNALLVMILATRLGASSGARVATGLIYAGNPVTAWLCSLATSEIVGITFLLCFLITVVSRPNLSVRSVLIGGWLLGCAILVRTNWLLIGCLASVGFLWIGRKDWRKNVMLVALFVVAFCLPLMPWLLRNAREFHAFPIFGAGGGETFYGGNNDFSAEFGGKHWGYLVFTYELPGEKPWYELARQMNEHEFDRYLMAKGFAWLKEHPGKVPGLIFGKLRRAYVPIPQSRGIEVLIVSMYRWGVYALASIGLWFYFRSSFRITGVAIVAIISVMLAHLITVVVFCGLPRFVVASDILLLLPAGYALWGILELGAREKDRAERIMR